MASSELSIEEIHNFFLEKGGKVSNKELVKHFKRYLTHHETKDDARQKFKKYINILAISRTEGEEKYLVLKPKYYDVPTTPPPPVFLPQNTIGLPLEMPFEVVSPLSSVRSPERPKQPPPYRPPPPVTSPSPSLDAISISSNLSSSMNMSMSENEPPQAPPRKRSVEKSKQSLDMDDQSENGDQIVSVKERTQKFNRMASVDIEQLSPQHQKEKKRPMGADEDDGASIGSVEPQKRTAWIVAAARADYHALAKLAGEDPRLPKIRDPFTGYTALHWAAKHGKEDIIKLCAGKYHADPNARTNGGYTPLHIAMQFNHLKVYHLLIDVYDANKDLRDWSGRKPSQYQNEKTTVIKADGYRNMKSRKKASEKDLGFLRIGSLNVRVKKTTEAFSNFLGVGGSASIVDSAFDRVQKSWGSADNINKENEMAAPKSLPPHKRKNKNHDENSQSQSTPASPNQKRLIAPQNIRQDSDSDLACGFGENWRN